MKSKEKTRCFLIYTGLFLIMTAVIFWNFFVSNKAVIWHTDGFNQHYKALVYYSRYLREILRGIFLDGEWRVPAYNFSMGYGMDVLTTLHYYAIGDPLNLMSVFVPEKYMGYFFTFLVFSRCYLAGAGFMLYVFYRRSVHSAAVLAGAFTYAFCGFVYRVVIWHPFFANPMIYLPLVFLGIEKIKKEKKPAVFILSVFVSAVSNFYFFYMIVLLTVIYVIFRVFMWFGKTEKKEAAVFVLKLTGYSLISVAMAAVILLPVIAAVLNSSRTLIERQVSVTYPSSYYTYFAGAFTTWKSPGYGTYMGFPAVCVLAVILLFLNRKKYRALANAYLLLTVFLLVPFVGRAFNAFNYVYNRWCFAYALLTAYVVCMMWDEFYVLTRDKKIKTAVFVVAYMVLCLFAKEGTKKNLCVVFAVLLLTAAVVFLQSLKPAEGRIRQLVNGMLCTLVMVNICITARYPNRAASSFMDYDETTQFISDVDQKIIDMGGDGNFSRYISSRHFSNSTLWSGLFSIKSYWTLTEGNLSRFYQELGLLNNTTFNFKSLDSRTILNSLAAVKYYVAENKPNALRSVPYGYRLCGGQDKEDDYLVYENQYALPFAYAYPAYQTVEQFEKLSPLEKQESMMYGAVLDTDADLSEYERAKVSFENKAIDYRMSCKKGGVDFSENEFIVTKKNSSVTLEFLGLPEAETYLYLEGLTFQDTKKQPPEEEEGTIEISAKAKDVNGKTDSLDFKYYREDYRRYCGKHDFLLNFFYGKEAKKSITLTFHEKGVYTLDSLGVYCLPMDNYKEQMKTLGCHQLENLDMHRNGVFLTERVTGEIALEKPQILYFTMPYSKGWTAYVDGKKKELIPANINFCALLLDAGEHEIELRYHTRGLTAGCVISLVGLVFFLIVIRKKQGNEDGTNCN